MPNGTVEVRNSARPCLGSGTWRRIWQHSLTDAGTITYAFTPPLFSGWLSVFGMGAFFELARVTRAREGDGGDSRQQRHNRCIYNKNLHALVRGLGWSEHWLEGKLNTSKEPPLQSQLFTLNNDIINLIKREKRDWFVGRMYHVDQDNELRSYCTLGSEDLVRIEECQVEISKRELYATLMDHEAALCR